MEGDEKATASKAHAKALAINLDPSIYGTFAEIGAGQEIAQWFLRVGAASGTVAQTICAYDKAFSDERYGKGTRYVSRERLLSMLEREYALVRGELGASRESTRFFSVADTVAARNFKGDNDQHGWVGIRFDMSPGSAPSDILLHVELRDPTAEQQGLTLGILGVNLIDAAFHHRASSDEFLKSLYEGLSRENLEVDVVELSGPAFDGVDGRLWCIRALRQRMCHLVMFDRTGHPVEPSTVLRKRPLLVQSGRFEATAPFRMDQLQAAERALRKEFPALEMTPTAIIDITVDDATASAAPDSELLARVERLTPVAAVAMSDHVQAYRLVEYLKRYTAEPIRLAVNVSGLAAIFLEDYYRALPGNLLEGLGKLFAENVKLYVSPVSLEVCRSHLGPAAAELLELPESGPVTVEHLRPRPPLDELLRYVRAAGWLVPTDSV